MMPPNRPSVSVIVPTLNEAQNLPLVLPRIPMEIVDEVILVDGRSTDGTVQVAQQILPTIKVVFEPKPGKGAALLAGYRAAAGDILVVIDADGSNDPRELPRFLRALLEGADFVKGSRFAHHAGTTDMPRYRQFGNYVFVQMVNLLFHSTFTDLCYGYHSFWRYCLDVIDVNDVDGFEIDTALYLRALRERLRIVEVPSFEGYRFHGLGKLQTIPDGWRVLQTIITEWLGTLSAMRHRTDYLGFRGSPALANADTLVSPVPAATSLHAATVRSFWDENLLIESVRLDSPWLQTITHALALQVNVRAVLQHALQLTLGSTGASAGSLLVLNDQCEVIEGCLISQGASEPLPAGYSEVVKDGLAGWAVRHRQPALVTSTREDPRWLRRAWEEAEGRSRSAMSVPFIVAGRIVGVLTLVHSRAGQFTEIDLERLANLATSVA